MKAADLQILKITLEFKLYTAGSGLLSRIIVRFRNHAFCCSGLERKKLDSITI